MLNGHMLLILVTNTVQIAQSTHVVIVKYLY